MVITVGRGGGGQCGQSSEGESSEAADDNSDIDVEMDERNRGLPSDDDDDDDDTDDDDEPSSSSEDEEDDNDVEPVSLTPPQRKPVFHAHTGQAILRAPVGAIALCASPTCRKPVSGQLRMFAYWESDQYLSSFHIQCLEDIWDMSEIRERIRVNGMNRTFSKFYWWRRSLMDDDKRELGELFAGRQRAAQEAPR